MKTTYVQKLKGQNIWVAVLDGKYIAEFNSKAAALTGIIVEKQRRARKN